MIYTRVSKDPRDQKRSVGEQETECREVCTREGWQVIATWTDNDRGASRWSNGTRPDYARLIDMLRDGAADVLVTWESSRAQRDLEAYVRLRNVCLEHGVLWSYKGRTYDFERTDDVFATGLDALLAEREASETRDRILRAVRANASRGRPHGKFLYGYRRVYDDDSGAYMFTEEREDQAAIIRECARRVDMGESLYSVAASLNAREIPAPRAGEMFTRTINGENRKVPASSRWRPEQVRRLLLNPAYVARRVLRGEVVGEAKWPAILDVETFERIGVRLTDPVRRTHRDGAVRHLLTGIAVAPCGGRVHSQKNRGTRSLMCVNDFCVSRREDWVENYVADAVIGRLSRPDAVDLFGEDDGDDAQESRQQIGELRAELDTYYEAAGEGRLSANGLAKVEARLLARIDEAERAARTTSSAAPVVVRDLVGAPDVRARWEALEDISQQREVVRWLADIRLLPAKRGAKRFDTKTVRIEWRRP